MARLQRKKTVNQKKKKKQKAENLTNDGQGATSENKPGAKLDAGKEAKKKAFQSKKAAFASKAAKKQKEETFIDKSVQFLREVKIELKQVAWPTKNQTVVSTVVVIILVIILSSFLGLVDTGLNFVMRLLLQ